MMNINDFPEEVLEQIIENCLDQPNLRLVCKRWDRVFRGQKLNWFLDYFESKASDLYLSYVDIWIAPHPYPNSTAHTCTEGIMSIRWNFTEHPNEWWYLLFKRCDVKSVLERYIGNSIILTDLTVFPNTKEYFKEKREKYIQHHTIQ
jgi:hypothetical protein